MKRVAVVSIIAAIGFVGMNEVSAQGQSGAATPANCDGTGACKVDVSVVQCFITPNPQSLTVRGRNVVIFWEMSNESTNYRFNAVDGIKLKQDDSDFDQ